MIADLVHQLALGALAEARGNPKMMARGGALWWRQLGGIMILLHDPLYDRRSKWRTH